MRHISIVMVLMGHLNLFAQKEDYFWINGYQTNQIGTGANGYSFDFSQNKMQIKYANPWYGFDGNNASICDKEGHLLFYCNGRGVMNRNHQLMPNGDSINENIWSQKYWKNPFWGYPTSQDIIILNDPKNENGYYLFHKQIQYNGIVTDSNQLKISYINMDLDNSLGDVVYKNKTFYENQNSLYFYLTAIRHENKRDWWIFQPLRNDSIYLSFLLDDNGITRMPNQNTHQYFDSDRSSASGTATFSPDGTKFAIYNYYDQLHVYDFDRATGLLSNHKKINVFKEEEIDRAQNRFSSVEWSPNGRFIYTASQVELHQVDMWAENPQNSIVLIDKYNGTLDPFTTMFFLMVQAPDCKIYMTPKNGSNSLHVINKPNEKGKACNFVQNGIKLPYPNGGGMPNFPRYRVDEEDKCDPTIISAFGETIYYRNELEVYPNPSTGLFTIKLPEHIVDANLVVTDINGQIIYKKELQHSVIEQIDITHQAAGRYNIEVYPLKNDDRIFYGRQVVKI